MSRNADDVDAGMMRPRQKPLIVIAEDNDDTRRVYGLILRHFGYEVEEATTGEDAVELIRHVQPNLALLDIGLPKLDGWQVSQILKTDPATRGIPLIAFSAYVNSTADLAGSTAFDGFILKPISPTELARRIDGYLRMVTTKTRRSARYSERFEQHLSGSESQL